MIDLFEHPQAMEILIILLKGEKNITGIRKDIINKYGNYPSYSGVVRSIECLESLGLIAREKKGRETIVSLTPKGDFVASHLKHIKEVNLEEG